MNALLKAVASAILADVEPGFQPGGEDVARYEVTEEFERPLKFDVTSGRQDAALYGRQGCPPPQSRALSRRDLLARFAQVFQGASDPDTRKPGAGMLREPAGKDACATSDAVVNQVAIIQGRHCLALTSFCAACVERCPVAGAMAVQSGMPQVVADVCTGCGICQQVCPAPTNAVLMLPRQRLARRQPVNSHEF